MKQLYSLCVLIFFFTVSLFPQGLQNDDTSLRPPNFIVPPAGVNSTGSNSDVGPLLTNGVLVTTFPDYSGNLHPMGIAFNGTHYYVCGGGTNPGDIAQLDAAFNLITTQNVALDCRSIFYNPADGQIYIKGYTNNGLFRLHTSPFDGTFDIVFTGIFQDNQSKVCASLDGSKLYDHNNGTAREYNSTTGAVLNTITLNLQHNLNWPRGVLVAHTGTYLLTYAHPVVYAYDPTNGNFVSACTLATQPSSSEWSMAYTNGMFFITDVSEGTWYAWTIDQGVPVELTSFTANVNNNEVTLNWATATETNNQGFEIERKALNREFEKIGYVAGFGTTTEPKSYSFKDSDIPAGNYFYRLKQIDFGGSFEYSDVIEAKVGNPEEFILEQNYPNPFNPTTTIKYSLPENSFVNLSLLNMLGEEIKTLVNEEQVAGTHTINFDADGLASGTYIYRLRTPSSVLTGKMLLIK
jgi:hypothetical protein